MNIETGIYRHYKNGDLYFVEGLEQDADSNDIKLRVRYHALYPGTKMPFSRSLESFSETVGLLIDKDDEPTKRFTLVQALPVEKMKILLPGTKVLGQCPENDKGLTVNTFLVEGVAFIADTICVQLRATFGTHEEYVPLNEFLEFFVIFNFQKAISLFKSAE